MGIWILIWSRLWVWWFFWKLMHVFLSRPRIPPQGWFLIQTLLPTPQTIMPVLLRGFQFNNNFWFAFLSLHISISPVWLIYWCWLFFLLLKGLHTDVRPIHIVSWGIVYFYEVINFLASKGSIFFFLSIEIYVDVDIILPSFCTGPALDNSAPTVAHYIK